MNRDLRIDFIRGVVLLLIVADHVLNNERSWDAWNAWYYIDAAPVFVFMSGLVCGMVYNRTVEKQGFLAAQKKSIRRCGQLYIAQLTILAAVMGLVFLFGRFENTNLSVFGLDKLMAHPLTALPRIFTLSYTPWLMDILVFYMVLLLALPAILVLYRKNRAVAMGVSVMLYAVAQVWPEFSPIEYGSGKPWFWNPLGWQILFFCGMWIGVERSTGRLRVPRNPWIITGAILTAIAIGIFKNSHSHYAESFHVVDRQRMAPMRVISLLVMAYLGAALLRTHWSVWKSSWACPIVRCGQHSLEVFCVGVVIDYTVSLTLISLKSPLIEAIVVTSGVLATIIAAYGVERWIARKPRQTDGLAAKPTVAGAIANARQAASPAPLTANASTPPTNRGRSAAGSGRLRPSHLDRDQNHRVADPFELPVNYDPWPEPSREPDSIATTHSAPARV